MKTFRFNTRHLSQAALGAVLLFGPAMSAQAQTLLYEWTFNNGDGTPDVSAGGGNLSIATVTGTGSSLGFSSIGGPGIGGANGELSVTGGGYSSGNTSVAIANNLAGLGTLSQISVGFWFNLGSGVASQFPRFVQFGAASTYDAGGKPAAANALNGIGSSINGWTSSAFPATTLQNGVGNATTSSDPQFGLTTILANTWYYEVITYDGTQTANNFSTYLGASPGSLSLVQRLSANLGSINFGSSASVLMGNDDSATAPRALSNGSLANVEIWSGILSTPEPAAGTLLALGGVLALRGIRRHS